MLWESTGSAHEDFLASCHLPLAYPESHLLLRLAKAQWLCDVWPFHSVVWLRFEVGSIYRSRIGFESVPNRFCNSKCGKEEDDDHDQDPLPKNLLHIWSWSSEKLLIERRITRTMTKIPSKKTLLHIWSWSSESYSSKYVPDRLHTQWPNRGQILPCGKKNDLQAPSHPSKTFR